MLTRLTENVRQTYFKLVDTWWKGRQLGPDDAKGNVKKEVAHVLESIVSKAIESFLPPSVAPSSKFVPKEIVLHPEVKFARRDLITQEAVRLTNANAPIALGPVLWEIVRLLYCFVQTLKNGAASPTNIHALLGRPSLLGVCLRPPRPKLCTTLHDSTPATYCAG